MDVNSGIVPVKSRTALASMILSQKRNKAMDAWLGICQREIKLYAKKCTATIL